MALERLTLADGTTSIEREHLARYRYIAPFGVGRAVLDIACGTGYGSRLLADANAASVLGVDLAEDAIAYACAHFDRPGLRFEVGDAQRLETIADATFDLVVSFETIEHVPDDRQFLRAIRRVMKPGATFCVSTPEFRVGPLVQRRTGRPSNPYHVREHTYDSLVASLGEAGFSVVDARGQMCVPRWRYWPPIEWVSKAIGYRLLGRGVRSRLHRRYHPDDVGLRLVPADSLPHYWVLTCVSRSPV